MLTHRPWLETHKIQQVLIHFALFWHQSTIKSCTIDWGTFPKVTSHCVCVCASSLAFLSVHWECDKWMCQSLMKHYDCSARHKAITRLRYIDSPQEKSCFNQPHIIWETKKKDVQLLMERVRPLKQHFFLPNLGELNSNFCSFLSLKSGCVGESCSFK